MADPVSMGAATALQMVGTVMSAVDQSRQLKASAATDRENARRSEFQGELQVLQSRRDERQASGAAIAAMGESGLAVGTGTAADLIRQNAVEREMEILNIRHQASQDAANLRVSAADKKRAARGAIISGILGAASQGAAGASAISGQSRLDGLAAAERASRVPRLAAPVGVYGAGSLGMGARGPMGMTLSRPGRIWDGGNY